MGRAHQNGSAMHAAAVDALYIQLSKFALHTNNAYVQHDLCVNLNRLNGSLQQRTTADYQAHRSRQAAQAAQIQAQLADRDAAAADADSSRLLDLVRAALRLASDWEAAALRHFSAAEVARTKLAGLPVRAQPAASAPTAPRPAPANARTPGRLVPESVHEIRRLLETDGSQLPEQVLSLMRLKVSQDPCSCWQPGNSHTYAT